MTVKQNYQHVEPATRTMPKIVRKLRRYGLGCILAPTYWLAAHRFPVPGLALHRQLSALSLRAIIWGHGRMLRESINALLYPIHLTRYFEFDFAMQSLIANPPQRLLDVSSPRMLLLLVLAKCASLKATLLNPDSNDLDVTKQWIQLLDLTERVETQACTIEDMSFCDGDFDMVTSLSVIEHIPNESPALRRIWKSLRTGGRLVVTLPCAARASDEYIDQNHYNILKPSEGNFVFLEHIYDQVQIEQKFFADFGRPVRMSIYGEKRSGLLRQSLMQRWSGADYDQWQEPYMMGKSYATYQTINDLPGEGVVGLEFLKK